MQLRLADNEWGFSVAQNNPFRIFRILQSIAKESVGEENMIDLSRGDPGYGFTPGVRGRRFMSYLLFLDTIFNRKGRRVITEWKESKWESLVNEIDAATRAEYGATAAQTNLEDLSTFLEEVSQMGRDQGLSYTPYHVLQAILRYSNVSGGTYHDPVGEEVCRVIVAWWHQKMVKTPIDYNDLIFVGGASHAIGVMFKLLGEEGLRYLRPGDRAMITSPVYAPYNAILESRGVEVFGLEIDPFTGVISDRSREELKTYSGEVKVVVLIDPNNPTGFSMDHSTLEEIAEFAKRKDALIITDEVYSSFFEPKVTMIDLCPERTIRIDARSKIERSTGLRFGDVLVTKEGQHYIMNHLLKDTVAAAGAGTTWVDLFRSAKAPGGIRGDFQHTTFVPGPAQMLGCAHIVLGAKEREEYRKAVSGNMDIFTSTLGLPHKGNMYYIIFDLNEVAGAKKQAVPVEEKLVELAKRGVIYIPSNLFFSQADRVSRDRLNTMRASVVNTTPENIKKAAEITKGYLANT